MGTAAAVGVAGAAALALTRDEEEGPLTEDAPPDAEALVSEELAGDTPDEAPDGVPDWLRDLDAAAVEGVAGPAVAETEEESPPDEAPDGVPDWL
ncbi:MAG: hypothetical protein GWN58_54525, partial [Anaerolineae bacterium]|nr:hypothetical protein [Anaerolineae bacterium]